MPKTQHPRPSGFYALTTLPLRMQDVHTRMRLVADPTRACTGRKLTFQRRLVTLWAWLMRFPACGFLPQISHCCAMITPESFRTWCAKHRFYRRFDDFGKVARPPTLLVVVCVVGRNHARSRSLHLFADSQHHPHRLFKAFLVAPKMSTGFCD